MKRIVLFLFCFPVALLSAHFPPLGKKPSILPVTDFSVSLGVLPVLSNRNDLSYVLSLQSPVKDQGNREVCSVFSAAAAIEQTFAFYFGNETDWDVSENFIQYAVFSDLTGKLTEGSNTEYNIPAVSRRGLLFEHQWPYEPEDWFGELNIQADRERTRRCRALEGRSLRFCYLTHQKAKHIPTLKRAAANLTEFELDQLSFEPITKRSKIKKLLDEGRSVVLGVEFFYGAWNHGLMEELGIGKASDALWYQGKVGAPTKKDIHMSRKHESGHSILVIGYDDRSKTYLFKNSWGEEFGRDNNLPGIGNKPGYGTIAYEYAENFGIFYQVDYWE